MRRLLPFVLWLCAASPAAAATVPGPTVEVGRGVAAYDTDPSNPRPPHEAFGVTRSTSAVYDDGRSVVAFGSDDGLRLVRQTRSGAWSAPELVSEKEDAIAGFVRGDHGPVGLLVSTDYPEPVGFLPLDGEGRAGPAERLPVDLIRSWETAHAADDGSVVFPTDGLTRMPDGTVTQTATPWGDTWWDMLGMTRAAARFVAVTDDGAHHLSTVERAPNGSWGAPVPFSDPARSSYLLDIAGATTGALAVLTQSMTPRDPTVRASVDLYLRSPEGTWTGPAKLGDGSVLFTKLAMSPGGTLALMLGEVNRTRLLIRHLDGGVENYADDVWRLAPELADTLLVNDAGRIDYLTASGEREARHGVLFTRDPGSCLIKTAETPPGTTGTQLRLRPDGTGLLAWGQLDGGVEATSLSQRQSLPSACPRTISSTATNQAPVFTLHAPERVTRRARRLSLLFNQSLEADLEVEVRGGGRRLGRTSVHRVAGERAVRLHLRPIPFRVRRLGVKVVARGSFGSVQRKAMVRVGRP